MHKRGMKDFFICFKRTDEGKELQNALERQGYTVGLFTDAVEMLEAFAARGCRAFFLDAAIEEGISFTKAIAILKNIAPEIPLIVSSDEDSLERERKTRAHNIFFYFIRPIPEAKLIEIARDSLKKSELGGHGAPRVSGTAGDSKESAKRPVEPAAGKDNKS